MGKKSVIQNKAELGLTKSSLDQRREEWKKTMLFSWVNAVVWHESWIHTLI